MSETHKQPMTNGELATKVANLTGKLAARASKLDVTHLAGNQFGESTLIFPGTVENPGTTIDVVQKFGTESIAVTVASPTGNGSDRHSAAIHGHKGSLGFNVNKQHVGWRNNQPALLSETTTHSERLAADDPAHPDAVRAAAESLGVIRGTLATAEIKQQQAAREAERVHF